MQSSRCGRSREAVGEAWGCRAWGQTWPCCAARQPAKFADAPVQDSPQMQRRQPCRIAGWSRRCDCRSVILLVRRVLHQASKRGNQLSASSVSAVADTKYSPLPILTADDLMYCELQWHARLLPLRKGGSGGEKDRKNECNCRQCIANLLTDHSLDSPFSGGSHQRPRVQLPVRVHLQRNGIPRRHRRALPECNQRLADAEPNPRVQHLEHSQRRRRVLVRSWRQYLSNAACALMFRPWMFLACQRWNIVQLGGGKLQLFELRLYRP